MAEHDDAWRFLELLVTKARSHADRVDILRKGLELGVPLNEIEDLFDRYEVARPNRNLGRQDPAAGDPVKDRPQNPAEG